MPPMPVPIPEPFAWIVDNPEFQLLSSESSDAYAYSAWAFRNGPFLVVVRLERGQVSADLGLIHESQQVPVWWLEDWERALDLPDDNGMECRLNRILVTVDSRTSRSKFRKLRKALGPARSCWAL